MAFAFRSGLIAPDAYLIRDKGTMPSVLQALIFQATDKGLAWCSWTDDSQIWLLTGNMQLDLSREHGSPVLNVQLYREDGELKDSDSWFVDKRGDWRRGADEILTE